MKVLFFGDIVGKIGREALKKELPQIKNKYQPELVLANAENLAHGSGITRKTVAEMQAAGIDFFTSGNHIWKKPEAKEFLLEKNCPVIQPANFMPKLGEGAKILEIKGTKKILLINLLGTAFIAEKTNCFFKTLEALLKKYENNKLAGIIVDFHAEATSEKQALGWYADGRVSAFLGTHTHVPTADAKILPKGTAYVSDIGMVGAADSVIGVKKEEVIEHLKAGRGTPFKLDLPKQGLAIINSVLLEIDPQTKKAIKIKRVDLETEI